LPDCKRRRQKKKRFRADRRRQKRRRPDGGGGVQLEDERILRPRRSPRRRSNPFVRRLRRRSHHLRRVFSRPGHRRLLQVRLGDGLVGDGAAVADAGRRGSLEHLGVQRLIETYLIRHCRWSKITKNVFAPVIPYSQILD